MSTNNRLTAEEAVKWLTPDTVQTLHALSSAPPEVIKETLTRVPFGSRAAMEALGIMTREHELTPFGHEVVKAIQRC